MIIYVVAGDTCLAYALFTETTGPYSNSRERDEKLRSINFLDTYARFPLPVNTGRVDERAFPLAELKTQNHVISTIYQGQSLYQV